MASRRRHIDLACVAVACFGALLALAAASCGRPPAPDAIDPLLASAVPPGATVLAGIDLARLRASTLATKAGLPDLLRGVSFGRAPYALVAWSADGLVAIARQPPGSPNASDPFVTGSPDAVRAALAQTRTGRTGAPDLIQQAADLIRRSPGNAAPPNTAWVVARGDATLPVTGNAANWNRILHATTYTTLAVRLDSGLELQAQGRCADPARARDLENSLRGLLTLAAAPLTGKPELARLPGAVAIRRDDSTVTATLAVPEQQAEALLAWLLKTR